MNINQGILVAQKVLDRMLVDFNVETFRDGDNSGYIILNEECNHNKVAYVTNDLKTNDINVYIGPFIKRGIPKEAYKKLKSFKLDDEYGAAIYIYENIRI